MSHTPTSVDRYIRDFERVKLLFAKGMNQSEIAYITSLSESLVIEYIKIVKDRMFKK
jgi:DNA-directed RNA polymerase specialized sigma subunit